MSRVAFQLRLAGCVTVQATAEKNKIRQHKIFKDHPLPLRSLDVSTLTPATGPRQLRKDALVAIHAYSQPVDFGTMSFHPFFANFQP